MSLPLVRGVGLLSPALLAAAVGLALAAVGFGYPAVQETVTIRGTVVLTAQPMRNYHRKSQYYCWFPMPPLAWFSPGRH